jgi:hypothetical protein
MDIKGLFGNPYVRWSPRPLKNGQPPPCYSQCNLNIGARKVGAALRRYPQIFMGPKSKDQILQKWDPVSKRLVNIHQRAIVIPPVAPERTHITIDDINLSYQIDAGDGVFFTYRLLSDKNDTINVALYQSNGTFIGSADPQNIIAGSTNFIDGIDINYTNGLVGTLLYIVATPTDGDPVVSGQLMVELRPTIATLSAVSFIYSAMGDSSFTYTISVNVAESVTVTPYDNGTESVIINGSSIGVSDTYVVYPDDPITTIALIQNDNMTPGNYYYLLVEPENGPVVVSGLFQAV